MLLYIPQLKHQIRFLTDKKMILFFQGQNPEGANGQDGDFMSEAKDWAGELISGQTGTGRILVSCQIRMLAKAHT